MRSLPRPGSIGPSHTASYYEAGAVSPATLRITREADATMTPDGWEADYSAPDFVDETPVVSPVFPLAGTLPTE
ncbi:hypothetical protein [Hymenobacter sp. PAMC 26628]|uniref:hypothetical protein n=1 Tax=Hymenobacter sp. PAMC 26628 TaxID=1484118 RepID=UPI0007704343|nr:hypothetical protein [Hymenobacter sp. PAMC 26628]AMJ66010.1 hypothetical protein AXW84_11635 [Hymenobacter sp. PAMC 26628]